MTNETQVMPAVALRGITILPDMIVHFDVSRKKSIRAIEEAMTKDQRIFLITQKDPKVEEPSEDDLYKIGTVAMIKQVAKAPKDMLRVLVEGMERAELMQLEDGTSYLEAEVDVLEQEEENLPGVIRRLKANEADLDAIKRNMAYLEGKKLEWSMQRSDSAKVQKVTRTAACYLLAVFITLFAFVGILSWYLNRDLQLVFTIMGFAAVGAGAFILIRYQDSTREIRQADVNRNQAITLENRVKIRYVNTKNAVDFICEKYHVRNGKELEYIWECYMDAVKQKEKFEQNSDDIDYFNNRMIRELSAYRLYDSRVWIPQAAALIDHKEMVEITHNLVMRRQKLRSRMEYNAGILKEQRTEVAKFMEEMPEMRPQIQDILDSVDRLSRP